MLYPTADVHPALSELAVDVPLHGEPVVILEPIDDEQPAGNGPVALVVLVVVVGFTAATVVPLHGAPVAVL